MPSECASIGQSPGPADHMYNAGTVGHFSTSGRGGEGASPPGNRQLRTVGYVECSYRLAARPTWVRSRGRAAWPPAP